MADGASRIFNIIHDTSEGTNPNTSKIVSLTVQSTQPLVFKRDDKLLITEEFCIIDPLVDVDNLEVNDVVTALVLSNGQQYYIKANDNNYIEQIINQIVDNAILEKNKQIYHIGKIIVDTSNTNPATYLGFGTWEYYGEGRTLVGVKSSDNDYNTVEKTGGSKTRTLTVANLPSHNFTFPFGKGTDDMNFDGGLSLIPAGADSDVSKGTCTTNSRGSGTAVDIKNPYITVYFWKRVS